MTKVLLVGAGAGYSTKDLEMGFYEAFQELGVELSYYMLDRRLFVAKQWLMYNWKHLLGEDPLRKPGWPDVIYRGGIEALEMALRYDVDMVFAVSAMYLHSDVIIMMRRAGLKVGILFTESPYLDDQQLPIASLANICFTNERTSVDYLRKANRNTHYLRHAFSTNRHSPTAPTEDNIMYLKEWQQFKDQKLKVSTSVAPSHDVVFVGTGFQERIDVLSNVDWSGIDLGLYGNWQLLPSRHRLRKYLRGGIMTNMNAHALYKKAKIGLNLYRTSKDYDRNPQHIEAAESMNPRAYELAASNIFSLTQYRKEAEETLGRTQPFFCDSLELENLVKYHLSNEHGREVIAARAMKEIQGHTFIERAKEVLSYND